MKPINPINQPASRFTLHFSLFTILVFCGLLLSLTLNVAQAQVTHWTNTGSGNFNSLANWDNGVPSHEDHLIGEVYITNGGTVIGFPIFIGLDLPATLTLTDSSIYGYAARSMNNSVIAISGSAVWDTDPAGEDDHSTEFEVGSGGILTLTDHGRINSSQGYVYGSAVVNGSAYWNISRSYSVHDTGSMTLAGSGSVVVGDVGGSIYNGTHIYGNGTLTISDSALWDNASFFTVGVSGNGAVLNLNGGTVRTGTMTLGTFGDGTSTDAGSGTLVIGGDGNGRLVNADGNATDIVSDGNRDNTVRFAHSGSIQFANVISGTNISVEHNSGHTTLTVDSAIKNLSVSGGELNISGTLTLQGGQSTVAGGELNVIAGGHLRGFGDVNGLLTVKDGGILATTLTFSNGLTLETGAILDFDGSLLVTGGTITMADGIIVDFSALTGTGTYTVLDWNGATTDGITADQFNIAGTDVEGTFEVQGTQLIFNATAVPEPSTYILLGAGLGILLLTSRRRRNVQS
jgi:hypothetical protein